MTDLWFGTMEFYDFPYIGIIIPTDELHDFSEGGRSTTNSRMSGFKIVNNGVLNYHESTYHSTTCRTVRPPMKASFSAGMKAKCLSLNDMPISDLAEATLVIPS